MAWRWGWFAPRLLLKCSLRRPVRRPSCVTCVTFWRRARHEMTMQREQQPPTNAHMLLTRFSPSYIEMNVRSCCCASQSRWCTRAQDTSVGVGFAFPCFLSKSGSFAMSGIQVVIVVAVAVAVVYAYSWTTVHFGIYIKGPAPATWTQEHAVAVCCYPVPFFFHGFLFCFCLFFSRSWFVSLLFFRRFIHLLLLLLVCYVLLLPLGCNNCWEESA